MVFCHHCGKTSDPGDRIGRTETCEHCGADLHVCYNCRHYDPKEYNECRETQADRVLEKDKANFCDYFSPSEVAMRAGAGKQKDDVKAKLDALFKKK